MVPIFLWAIYINKCMIQGYKSGFKKLSAHIINEEIKLKKHDFCCKTA